MKRKLLFLLIAILVSAQTQAYQIHDSKKQDKKTYIKGKRFKKPDNYFHFSIGASVLDGNSKFHTFLPPSQGGPSLQFGAGGDHWDFFFNFSLYNGKLKRPIKVADYLDRGKRVNFYNLGLNAGYRILQNRYFTLTPYAGISLFEIYEARNNKGDEEEEKTKKIHCFAPKVGMKLDLHLFSSTKISYQDCVAEYKDLFTISFATEWVSYDLISIGQGDYLQFSLCFNYLRACYYD
ncbi:MAG: autotransporter outer membrane beta-barrel domain-containing protein [Bacteroidales bacterium]